MVTQQLHWFYKCLFNLTYFAFWNVHFFPLGDVDILGGTHLDFNDLLDERNSQLHIRNGSNIERYLQYSELFDDHLRNMNVYNEVIRVKRNTAKRSKVIQNYK